MADDPFAPPGSPGAPPPYWGGQAPSPWTRSPWGPPESGQWGPPGSAAPDAPGSWDVPPQVDPQWNVVQPLDPFETLMHRRRRGLWYGFAALGLAVLIPPVAFAGVVLLIVGVGLLMLLGVVAAVVTSAVWAVVSLVMISRNRTGTASDVPWMLPALSALGLVAYYVTWFVIRT